MRCVRCTQLSETTRRYDVTKSHGFVVQRDLCQDCREATAAVYKVKLSRVQPEAPVAPPEPEAPSEPAEPEARAPAELAPAATTAATTTESEVRE